MMSSQQQQHSQNGVDYESSRITNLPNHLYNLNLNHNGGNATTSSAGSSSGYDSASLSNAMGVYPISNGHHNGNNHNGTNGNSHHDVHHYNGGTIGSTNGTLYNPYVSGSSISRAHNPHSNTNTISSGTTNTYMSMIASGAENNQLNSEELTRLMNEAVSHMDLPPDKLKIVKMLPDEKKYQFIQSLQFVTEKQPPEYYIQALAIYTDTICNNKMSSRRAKIEINESSTQLIKNLEVSLRTNRIEWVHKFLDPPFNGLDVLIEYLKTTINFIKETDRFNSDLETSLSGVGAFNGYNTATLGSNGSKDNMSISSGMTTASHLNHHVPNIMSSMSSSLIGGSSRKENSLSALASLERRHSRVQKDTRKRMSKHKMGEPADDVHECVRCLRAIMNHQYGFHMIIGIE